MKAVPTFDLEKTRDQLQQRKHELEGRVHHIRDDAMHRNAAVSADWAEQAVERENDEVLHALGAASDQELVSVIKALGRIEREEYLYCENCGEAIAAQRLQAMPYTSLCRDCAEHEEQKNHYA